MVLTDLGRKINQTLSQLTTSLSSSNSFDEATLTSLLKGICTALLEADVNVKLVHSLRQQLQTQLSSTFTSTNSSQFNNNPLALKRKVTQHVFEALVQLMDPKPSSKSTTTNSWSPKRHQCQLIMLVGLQGAGKTTTCTKLALYYQKKGFKTALICTDTFRAGAFDQLKQNAIRAKLPFYGSYTESDPAKIALEGIERFKKENFELIFIDTSGCHVTETALFGEMTQLAILVKPDHIIFVLDGAIGQSAEIQAKNFKQAVNVGSIILTKMDGGNTKGGGAISAVAATRSPIIFIGTGEHLNDLERFEVQGFVSQMLGMGNLGGLVEKLQDMQMDQGGLMKTMEQGVFTFRDLRDQLQNLIKLGPLSKVMNLVPGMPELGREGDALGQQKLRKLIAMMDSMTLAELNDGGELVSKSSSRLKRIAIGSGSSLMEVQMLIGMHQQFATMVKTMGGKNGFLSKLQTLQEHAPTNPKGGLPKGMNPMKMAKMQKQVQNMMSPQMMKQLRQMAQQQGGKNSPGGVGMPDMQSLMQQFMPPMMGNGNANGNEGSGMGGSGFPGFGGALQSLLGSNAGGFPFGNMMGARPPRSSSSSSSSSKRK